jgi:hypothetical protein
MITSTTSPNLVVGFSDGSGASYADFAHGLDFTASTSRQLQVFENGTSRGGVGAWTPNTLYRVRVTLDGDGSASYEIQGGPEYPRIGGDQWANVTPTTSSSPTQTVYPAVCSQTSEAFVSDVKVL